MEGIFAGLKHRLDAAAPPEAREWLDQFLDRQSTRFELRPFYYAFSGATRRFPKAPLPDDTLLLPAAPEFSPHGWTLDQLARTVLLLSLVQQDRDTFLSTYAALHDTADLRESVALHAALPLLPYPDALVPHAREGLRSNIVDVFDAIALDNPFPAAQFDDEGWNQMILKAIFIRRPVHRIHGLDRRANAPLAQALSDLAHERWAANRPVPPELWRSCQGFVTPGIAADLARVLTIPGPGQREAVALLVAADQDGTLDALRPQVADLLPEVAAHRLSWTSLGQSLESAPA